MVTNVEMMTHERKDPPGRPVLPPVQPTGRIVILDGSRSPAGGGGIEEVHEHEEDFGTSLGKTGGGDVPEDCLPYPLRDASTKDAPTNGDREKSWDPLRASKTLLDADNYNSSDNADACEEPERKPRRKPQVASRLPWRDRDGVLGRYTGQIDRWMRPHGYGALIYDDGSSVTSAWEGGLPVRSWTPGELKKNRRKKHSRRRTPPQPPYGRSGSPSGSSSNNENEDAIASHTAKKQQKQAVDERQPPKQRRQPKSLLTRGGGTSKNDEGSGSSGSSDSSNINPTFLPHLDLGDPGAPQDMVEVESCQSLAFETIIAQLQMHDFAFVLRSDDRWTYAIVAEKRGDAMVFVVDGDGRTKTMARKHWAESIRLVNPEARRSRGGIDVSSSDIEEDDGGKRDEKTVGGKCSPGPSCRGSDGEEGDSGKHDKMTVGGMCSPGPSYRGSYVGSIDSEGGGGGAWNEKTVGGKFSSGRSWGSDISSSNGEEGKRDGKTVGGNCSPGPSCRGGDVSSDGEEGDGGEWDEKTNDADRSYRGSDVSSSGSDEGDGSKRGEKINDLDRSCKSNNVSSSGRERDEKTFSSKYSPGRGRGLGLRRRHASRRSI